MLQYSFPAAGTFLCSEISTFSPAHSEILKTMTMYLEHFGFTEAPFKITPHTEFFFAGANRGETLEALIYAITSGEGMVKVTGEVGAGKTMLCRVLMERLPKTVETIYLAVPSLSRDELLAVIAGDLGIDTQGGNTTKLVRALQERLIEIHAEGKQVVALIDEAHAMPLETLEQIRLLSNLETSHDKLMQIVLFGQPELDQHLMLPHRRQLKERITHRFNLLPLPAHDIKDYLDFRLRAAGYKGADLFGPASLELIADASEGLTRRINIYADKTLLAAYASNTHTVTEDHVRAAISDTQILLPEIPNQNWLFWLSVATALLVGSGLGFLVGRMTAKSPTTSAEIVQNLVSKPIIVAPAPTSAAVPSPTIAPAPSAPPPTLATSASGLAPAAVSAPATGNAVAGEAPATTPSSGASTGAPTNAAVSNDFAPTLSKTLSTAGDTPKRVEVVEKDWLYIRMQADLKRLRSLKASNYAIQLMTADAREKSAIENYLRAVSRELNPDRVMIYPTGTDENPRVSVLYGSYTDRADANGEISSLPTKLQKFSPYARSMQVIRDDIRPGQ